MSVNIQRSVPEPPPINPITNIELKSEGGSGSFITARVRATNPKRQIAFNGDFGKGPSTLDNLNVSFETARQFAEAILALCEQEGH